MVQLGLSAMGEEKISTREFSTASLRKSHKKQRNEAVKKRPKTAPVKRASSTNKNTRVSIHNIISKSGGAKPEGMAFVLLDKTRKEVEAVREVYDRSRFDLKAKELELHELELTLQDLVKDGKGLGLNEFKEEERMQPVLCVSNRPMFTKHTRIEEMEKQLKAKYDKWQYELYMSKVYSHMKIRLMGEKVQRERRNRDMKKAVKDVSIKNQDLKREDLHFSDVLSQAQNELNKAKQECTEEMELWKRELASREKFVEKKNKVRSFYKQAEVRQKQIEEKRKIDKKNEVSRKITVNNIKNATLDKKKMVAQLLKSTQEPLFEDAFKKIGIKLNEQNPSVAVKICLGQETVLSDLNMQVKEAEEKLHNLKTTLEASKSACQDVIFASGQRTTNRVLAKHEKVLNDQEKMYQTEKAEYDFAQEIVRPVKFGLVELAQKLLVETYEAETKNINYSKVIEDIADKLSNIVERLPEGSAFHTKSTIPIPTALPSSNLPRDQKPEWNSTAAARKDSNTAVASPYNIRVDPSRYKQTEAFEQNSFFPEDTGMNLQEMSYGFGVRQVYSSSSSDSGCSDDEVKKNTNKAKNTELDIVPDRNSIKASSRKKSVMKVKKKKAAVIPNYMKAKKKSIAEPLPFEELA